MKTECNVKVIVGMSGGVDSSVAALLLKQAGYHVEGLFMKNWEADDEGHCPWTDDLADAKSVCTRLGITLHTTNFAKEYWDNVFTHFLQEYNRGRTPNPDVLCNKEIKFKAFLSHAINLGADYIATGHYVRRSTIGAQEYLLKAQDLNKDQSYFLYTLQQAQLKKSLFPLGELQKSDVRAIAHENGFINHNKKDSTGICFIGERKFKAFLNEYLLGTPGNIETLAGQVIGKHDGLMFHTVGQRKGLRIGGMNNSDGLPWYVIKKDLSRNALIVAQGHNHPHLFAHSLLCNDISWVAEKAPTLPLRCTAKTRYRQSDKPCTINELDHNRLLVKFDNAERAITLGQSVVFYQDDYCLGGGIIDEVIDEV